MQMTRRHAALWCGISLSLGGCSGTDTKAPEAPSVEVAQVETVTTVQSSAGLFLSPTPERDVPAYVERSAEATSALSADQTERAKVDVALLFRTARTGTFSRELNAELVSPSAAPWSPMQHYFPHVEATPRGVSWPLVLSSMDGTEFDEAVSAEWRGWRNFRGLGVRGTQSTGSAPVATLDFETIGRESPLILSAEGDTLYVTNRSQYPVERALLIYSHPGGVGVTAVSTLAPGERTVTVLGPKEHPPDTLLALAREQLTAFFSESVGAELGAAMAEAKSIPFLENQGLRLIALLNETLEPAAVSLSVPVTAQQRFVVSHSEILKPEEEARVLSVVSDPSIDAAQALATFGRFTEAKLEFGTQSADAVARANSMGLLAELRSR